MFEWIQIMLQPVRKSIKVQYEQLNYSQNYITLMIHPSVQIT